MEVAIYTPIFSYISYIKVKFENSGSSNNFQLEAKGPRKVAIK